jgi:hypothetical protein
VPLRIEGETNMARIGVSPGGSRIGSGRLATPSPGGIGSRSDTVPRGKGRVHRADQGATVPGAGAVTPVGTSPGPVPDKIGGKF